MCPDCITFPRLAKQWNVSTKFLGDLVRSGRLATHEHGARTTITRESAQECMWLIAVAKADLNEEAA